MNLPQIRSMYKSNEFDFETKQKMDDFAALQYVTGASNEKFDDLTPDVQRAVQNAFKDNPDELQELVKQNDQAANTVTADSVEPQTGTLPKEAQAAVDDMLSPLEKNSATLYKGKSLSDDADLYSYEFLTKLPDVQAILIPDIADITVDGKIPRDVVVSNGLKNVLENGTFKNGLYFVQNFYTKRDIQVTNSSIRHGLGGKNERVLLNARISNVIGEVVRNAVPINALKDSSPAAKGTYAMACPLSDGHGNSYIAIITVEGRDNSLTGFDVYDVLHSVNARKRKMQPGGQMSQGVNPSSTAQMSISDFLRIVKETHQSILSQDVLEHFNEERNPNGYYSGRAKFSLLNGVDTKVSATMPSDTVITADTNGVVAVDASFSPGIAKVTDALSKRTGLKFGYAEYYQNGKRNDAYNGHYDPTTKTIYFRKGASEEEIIYQTAVHELTHFAESSKHYAYVSDFVLNKKYEGVDSDAYKNAVKEKISAYAKNGVELTPEEARKELVAENVRKVIFESKEEVDKLVKTDYTFAQRILDIIDSFIYHFNNKFGRLEGDAKIHADLEQARRKYRLALASANGMREGGDLKRQNLYAITKADVDKVQSMSSKSVSEFSSTDIENTKNLAKKYFEEIGVKSPFFRAWFGDWRENDQTSVRVANQAGKGRKTIENNDTGWSIQVSGRVFTETTVHKSGKSKKAVPYLEYINSIVQNAVLLDSTTIPRDKAKSPNSVMMHHLYAVADIGNGKEVLKLDVEELNDVNNDGTINRAYKLVLPAASVRVRNIVPSSITKTAGNIKSVADLFQYVKTFDPDFKYNPTSLICNEDGTPKIMYHQTGGFFWTFKNGRAVAGKNDSETPDGYFFKTNDHDIGLEGRLQMAVFLKAENVLSFKNRKEANRWYCENIPGYESLQKQMRQEIDAIDEEMELLEDRMFGEGVDENGELYAQLNERWDSLLSVMEQKENEYKRMLRDALNNYFLNGGSQYDALEIEYDGHRYVGEDRHREDVHTVIVFSPNQIKSATHNIGTFDKTKFDTRFSFSSPKTDNAPAGVEDFDVPKKDVNPELQKMLDDHDVVKSSDGSVRTLAQERAAQAAKKKLGNDILFSGADSATHQEAKGENAPRINPEEIAKLDVSDNVKREIESSRIKVDTSEAFAEKAKRLDVRQRGKLAQIPRNLLAKFFKIKLMDEPLNLIM